MKLSPPAAKTAELDGARLPSAESLRREFPALVFTPDRLAVVKGGPAARRAYFDRVLGAARPGAARRCRRTTPRRSRSATPRCGGSQLGSRRRGAVAPWTSAWLSSARASSTAARGRRRALAPGFAAARGRARSSRRLARATTASRRPPTRSTPVSTRDIARGATGLGPHLDDVGIALRRPRPAQLRLAGRAAAGAARAAPGGGGAAPPPPLLLLDDVLSELDAAAAACWRSGVAGSGRP